MAACGGGGGGGSPSSPANPPPTTPPPTTPPPSSNAPPSVEAGNPQTIEWPKSTAQVTGTATDDSTTSTLAYTWSATSGPSGVTFGSANAAATSVTFPSAGTYVLTLSVSDGNSSGTDTVTVTVNPAVYPASDTTNSDPANHGWTRVTAAADVAMDQALLDQAATYASTSGTVVANQNAGMVVRHGRIVHSWGNIDQRFDMKSTTKSIGGIALGLAMDDGLLALTDNAQTRYSALASLPASNASTGYVDDITVLQLATHTAGFTKPGGYYVSNTDLVSPTLVYAPGTTWAYSDSGLNWLSELLTTVVNQDLSLLLRTDVWTPLGLNSGEGGANPPGGSISDVHWRDNQLRDNSTAQPHKRELASGIYANANAMARVGLLFLRKGVWANDQRILSESFVDTVRTPSPSIANAVIPPAIQGDYPGATTNYGVLWWTNATGLLPNVPRDAYWAWGLGDSLIVVIPSLDLVVVRAGQQAPINSSLGQRVWNDDDWNGNYAVLAPFLDPIVQAVTDD